MDLLLKPHIGVFLCNMVNGGGGRRKAGAMEQFLAKCGVLWLPPKNILSKDAKLKIMANDIFE